MISKYHWCKKSLTWKKRNTKIIDCSARERRRIERLTSQITEINARAAKLTKEIEKQTKIETAKLTKEIERQTEIEIIRNVQTEIKNRNKLKKQPEKTYKRRSRRLGLPHVDLRLPWTEITPPKTYTLQPERTSRCVVQNVNNSTTKEELQKEFERYGPIRKTEFIYSESKMVIHYAKITFENMVQKDMLASWSNF